MKLKPWYTKHIWKKTNINAESDIIYEIFKKIVPTFTEEIIASIYVSGFREKNNEIADKILDIYRKYHPSNLVDFLYNKMTQSKNIIYIYSSIKDDLIISNNDNMNLIIDNNNSKIFRIFNDNITIQLLAESIKSIYELEKTINIFINDKHKNLFILKCSVQENFNKMNQINCLIDDCLLKYNKRTNIENKYFVLIIYLIRENNEIKIFQEKNKYNILSSSCIIPKLTNNSKHVFIDTLNSKYYDFIKLLTSYNNYLFDFFFFDELKFNIETPFIYMEYEFSNNETSELNYKNYIKKMTEEIFDNEYTLNILKKCLLKFSLETRQILKLIF